MNTQAYIPQLLSPEQVHEALAKHIKMEFAEVGTNDWSLIDEKSNIGIRDFYSGFLKFRFAGGLAHADERDRKLRAASFFCECLEPDGSNNERYRVGFDHPSVYVLVRSPGANANTKLKDFEFYKESNGKLYLYSISEKVIEAIYKARTAKQNAAYNQKLEQTGHFQSQGYKDYKRKQRGLSVR
ncbi:hypothetical protein LVY74_02195 [Acinetobacter sp. ME22]|uniref:hypothetical protein n=1 Tax=Acinetobacter sp. ME22 TaxID=2904802 RepID=UPI001EDA9571|nr:hypothetical protein [Acinetobacter sp. ME22]MCG2572368.1 hypothetical protein [Acinetobacter sp. ME22]